MTQRSVLSSLLLVSALLYLQACTVNVPVSVPDVSTTPYETANQTVEVSLLDALDVSHQVSQGGLPLKVSHNDKPLNAQFFFENLESELQGRGMNVAVVENADHVLRLNDFAIFHHRVSGFSPMVTLSTVSADLETSAGTQRIASFIRRAKVPVWSMDEIIEPCYNQSIEILLREVAAKLNKELFDTSLDDETVNTLINKIDQSVDGETFLDVLELGYSNNPLAVPVLFRLSSHKGEYIRQAAITGLGIFGATEHFEHLKDIYLNAESWADRGTALKAIGDLGTPEAMDVLAEARANWQEKTGNEAAWNLRILGLYLD